MGAKYFLEIVVITTAILFVVAFVVADDDDENGDVKYGKDPPWWDKKAIKDCEPEYECCLGRNCKPGYYCANHECHSYYPKKKPYYRVRELQILKF